MKTTRALITILILTFASSIVYADVYIGPAFRADFGSCGVYGIDYAYEGPKATFQHSNGNTGHATFKCKLYLYSGDPQISSMEFTTEDFWEEGAVCDHTIYLDGKRGMWTAQCFYFWNADD